METRLARAYRRLLWAYPRDYRRARGTEMLTTLLDAAEPGRRRPAFRDALNLVVRGLRCRLSVPNHPGYVVVACLAAMAVAGIGAWSGAMAGWQRGTSLPTTGEVVAAATVAVPDAGRYLPARQRNCDWHCLGNPSDDMVVFRGPYVRDDLMPEWTADRPRTTNPAANRVYLPLAMAHADMVTIAGQAHDRLAAAGWRVTPVRTYYDMRLFWATKGDLTLRFEGRGTTQPESPAVAFVVHHDLPPATLPAAAAGAAAGALLGWWLAAFALRRYRRHGPGRRTAMLVTALPALIMTALISAQVAMVTAYDLISGAGTGEAASFLLGLPLQQYGLAILSIGVLASLVLALTRADPLPDRRLTAV
ncbi:hypothetical protein [Virgisporangium aurantiacum]|uniref:Uncharacterized protein n=1 Tax=Virgisporangium aurantiacum TaxID=175570 RepID=A0A8J3ZDH8_9ACTN|nr:hypothetical protein [Virgisporangium aurantiacum]GIJ60892.1 hypothetical protein Vau01_084080 [Virgisporangium aurantiacum]